MSETVAKKQEPGILKLTAVLAVICLVCALLLGLVNMITAGPIEAAKQRKTEAAMKAVLVADSYDMVEYTGGDPLVKSVYLAGDEGFVVEVIPTGFGGVIDLMVGVDNDGVVTGISIITHSETAGLGAKAKTDPQWSKQFIGQSGEVKVSKDGGTIDAITSATVTSRAVSKGVTAALSAVQSLA